MELFGQVNRHDDALAACFPILLVAVVVTVALLVALGQRSSFRQTLARVATHLHGRLQPGNLFQNHDRVQFTHGGQPAELRFSREGKDRRYTHLEMEWAGPSLRCEVYPEGFLASLRKLMGMEDIVIGSRRFDSEFIISGDDVSAIKSLLNAQVQAAIFNLDEYVDGMHIRFSPRSLTVNCRGRMTDFVRLIEFVRQCRELYDSAVVAQGQGIEFLEGGGISLRSGTPAAARCMVCGEGLESNVVYCRSCRTPHHRDCWTYSGGCSTYGCREKSFVR